MHRSEKCKHGWSLYSPTKCFKCQDELVGRPPWGYVETTSFITGDSGDENDYRPIDKVFGKPGPVYVETESSSEYPAPMLTPEIAIAPQHSRLLDGMTSERRKQYPIATGLFDYFPDALAEVAYVSWVGNEKHNPGESMHHARGKSMDHADCCARHLQQRGTTEVIIVRGTPYNIRHTAELAWRSMALLQEELERELGLTLPRGAK